MSMNKQRVTILGSTGSIGVNTLDVISRHPQRYEVFALSANRQVDAMLKQCAQFKPRYAVMVDDSAAQVLRARVQAEGLGTQVLSGADALQTVAAHPDCDSVMAAIVGAAGLPSCLAAARAGKRLMLANKEALVVGGTLFMDAVREGGAELLPIDSEHSAVFQSLPTDRALWNNIDKIVLTASGGPFRTRDPETLRDVTPEQAVAHPNWVMGRKISVDSATMMNKALEVIEARWLFDVQPRQIEVLIHPQSIIHSMVQYKDNSTMAQLGTPDMRVPIACGLSWPERIQSGAAALDWTQITGMSFEPPDKRRFPGLKLAWQTLEGAPGATAVLNAANEVAVAAFLERRIRFDQIHAVNQSCMAQMSPAVPHNLDDLLALDAQARAVAEGAVRLLAR